MEGDFPTEKGEESGVQRWWHLRGVEEPLLVASVFLMKVLIVRNYKHSQFSLFS